MEIKATELVEIVEAFGDERVRQVHTRYVQLLNEQAQAFIQAVGKAKAAMNEVARYVDCGPEKDKASYVPLSEALRIVNALDPRPAHAGSPLEKRYPEMFKPEGT